jgi:2-keto-4-pentenoate hydratase/2-oxohepta-3-ene-1,7-dioic acid hydratase in catechol pathway
VSEVRHPKTGRIWLAVGGVVKQDSDISKLIWPAPDIISICSYSMALKPGDIIMTGTPEGVGPRAARRGDDRRDRWAGRDKDLGNIAQIAVLNQNNPLRQVKYE